jgi:hypothetical protein
LLRFRAAQGTKDGDEKSGGSNPLHALHPRTNIGGQTEFAVQNCGRPKPV